MVFVCALDVVIGSILVTRSRQFDQKYLEIDADNLYGELDKNFMICPLMLGTFATIGTSMNDFLSLSLTSELVTILGRNTIRGQIFILLQVIFNFGTLLLSLTLAIYCVIYFLQFDYQANEEDTSSSSKFMIKMQADE